MDVGGDDMNPAERNSEVRPLLGRTVVGQPVGDARGETRKS
jgi:hypothetical protein